MREEEKEDGGRHASRVGGREGGREGKGSEEGREEGGSWRKGESRRLREQWLISYRI